MYGRTLYLIPPDDITIEMKMLSSQGGIREAGIYNSCPSNCRGSKLCVLFIKYRTTPIGV
jgi:hypothetical protein